MNINGLTTEQIISLALFKSTIDYLELLDYDTVDWEEWGDIHRN